MSQNAETLTKFISLCQERMGDAQDLLDFLAAHPKVDEQTTVSIDSVPHAVVRQEPPHAVRGRFAGSSVRLAIRAVLEHAKVPMTLSEITDEVVSGGWRGTKGDGLHNARQTVYQALKKHPDAFHQPEAKMWELVPQEPAETEELR